MRRLITVLAHRAGVLERLMSTYPFRKVIGGRARVHAWRLLGLQGSGDLELSSRVWMRFPANVTIGEGTMIGGRTLIEAWDTVSIGRNCIFNDDVKLLCAKHSLDSPGFEIETQPIVIGDYAWLPHRILVLAGVSIGDYAVIGSGSVVTRDVGSYEVVAGNPAQKIGERVRGDYTYVPRDL